MVTAKLYTFLNTITGYKNYWILFTFIFLTLFQYQPPNGRLSPVEEMYFGYALALNEKIQINDSSFGLKEMQTRFLFDKFTTLLISNFGHENSQKIGRFICLIMYSLSLALLFNTIGINLLQTILCLLIFLYFGQNLFGGGGFFYNYHNTSLAYPILFLGITYLIKRKYFESIIIAGCVTYIHFLIGGWFSIYLFILFFINEANLKNLLKYVFLYIIIIFPIGYYLIKTYFSIPELQTFLDLPSSDWIYSAFRHPHHLAPFLNLRYFYFNWLTGIVLSIPLAVLSLVFYKNYKKDIHKNIALLNLIILIQLYICLILAFFDESYILGKLYMFRSSSLVLFLSAILFILWIDNLIKERKVKRYLNLFLFSLFFSYHIVQFPKFLQIFNKTNAYEKSLTDFVINNTLPEEVILIDPALESKLYYFERLTNRPTLVTWKFIPTTKIGIYEWYRRLNFKKKIFANSQTNGEYNYTYLITNSENIFMNKKYGSPIFSEEYIIYKNENYPNN